VWVDSPGEYTGPGHRGSPPPQTAVDPARAPIQYIETELNSPIVRLDPGETYAMDTQWFPSRMGSELKTVTYAGLDLGAAPVQDVTPFEVVNLEQTLQAPGDTARISLHLVDRIGPGTVRRSSGKLALRRRFVTE
jgi:hypothetical protein